MYYFRDSLASSFRNLFENYSRSFFGSSFWEFIWEFLCESIWEFIQEFFQEFFGNYIGILLEIILGILSRILLGIIIRAMIFTQNTKVLYITYILQNIKHHNHAIFMNQKVVTQNFIIEPTGDKYFTRQAKIKTNHQTFGM